MELPGKRILKWREFKGLTSREFEELTGVPYTTLKTLEKNTDPSKVKPSYDVLAKILQAFPDLSSDWLLLGTGEMLRNGQNLTPVERPEAAPAKVTQAPTSDLELVADLREQRDRWQDEAETWRDLYLQEIGKSDRVGKLPGSEDAAPLPQLTYTVTPHAVGFKQGYKALEEIRDVVQASESKGLMWIVEEVGSATEQEAEKAA